MGGAEEKVLSSAPLKGDPNRVLTRMPSLTGTDSSSRVCLQGGLQRPECARYLCIYYEKGKYPRRSLNNSLIFSHTSASRNANRTRSHWRSFHVHRISSNEVNLRLSRHQRRSMGSGSVMQLQATSFFTNCENTKGTRCQYLMNYLLLN